jgi:two-component system sensor histidine kinase UhpB
LHDETAQVFSSLKMQLGVAREQADPALAARLDRALDLVDDGMVSIRSVTRDLRPALLDDLGLLAALRSLVEDFRERTGLAAVLNAPAELPELPPGADVAIFRAIQEGLSNVAAHSQASRVTISLGEENGSLRLSMKDDGRGPSKDLDLVALELEGHMGLAGMRERITALGGEVRTGGRPGAGFTLEILMPSAVRSEI